LSDVGCRKFQLTFSGLKHCEKLFYKQEIPMLGFKISLEVSTYFAVS